MLLQAHLRLWKLGSHTFKAASGEHNRLASPRLRLRYEIGSESCHWQCCLLHWRGLDEAGSRQRPDNFLRQHKICKRVRAACDVRRSQAILWNDTTMLEWFCLHDPSAAPRCKWCISSCSTANLSGKFSSFSILPTLAIQSWRPNLSTSPRSFCKLILPGLVTHCRDKLHICQWLAHPRFLP